MKNIIPDIRGLKSILNRFNSNGRYAKSGEWSIAQGGYDLNYEIYYGGEPVIRCIGGDIETMSNSLGPETTKEIADLVFNMYGDRFQEKFINLNEKKYQTAEILMFFEDAKSRDKAFGVLLDHDENVYRFDAHYSPAFPGADAEDALEKGLVIYADIYSDIEKEVPEFVEDMQTLVPGKIISYRYNPIAESMNESRMADVDIICNEVIEDNKKASPKDIADKLVSVLNISDEHAMEFAEDFLKSQTLNESKEKSIEVDFPIFVNEKGRIKANDAKKLLKYLNKLGILRVGRTYFVKDSTGNETCWDLTRDTFDGFLFSCEVTEVNGEEVDFYNALYFSKGKKGFTDYEWESHRVESKENLSSRLQESKQLCDDITLDNIEYVDDNNVEYDSYEESAWGDVKVEITATNHKTGESVKEYWIAEGCKGSIVGLQVEKEHLTADPYYSSPGYVDWDYIDWYSCDDGAYWDKTISGPKDFWDGDYEDCLDKVSDAIAEFVDNSCKFYERVEDMKVKDKLKESIPVSNKISIENIEVYDDDYLNYELSHDGYFRGDVYVTVTFKFQDEIIKEIWGATDCEGSLIPGDEAYDDFESEIGWYDCLGDIYFEKYFEVPSEDYAFQRHFWDTLETDGKSEKRIKDAIRKFIKDGCVFKEEFDEKLNEALTYKYRIVLDQPEGSNYRLTNSDKLKFKTEEEAQKRLDDMMKYMGDRLKSKGMGLKIEEIQPKERKKRASYKDNPDFVNPFKVGDIVDGDVGYSMSLPEFWRIIKVSDASVVARKLKSKIVSQDDWGQSGYKIPDEDNYDKDYDGNYIESRFSVKTPKFPRYYNQPREEFDKELTENPEKMCYLWGRGHIFSKYDGEPKVWDTYD